MKQTAVEWLYEQMFLSQKNIIEYRNILEQAKEMEKQQIIDASEFGNDYDNPIVIDGKQYYNETFKK